MNIPDNLKYTKEHEWILIEGNIITVGITDHAQAELTDVVFVELPEISKEVEENDPMAVVESVKAASDIYAPLAGKIIETNTQLESDPSLINNTPYAEGWICKIELRDASQVENLMNASDYQGFIS